MASQTVWCTADCSRSTTTTNTAANASVFGTTSTHTIVFSGDNAYDNGSNAEYTGHFTTAYGSGRIARGVAIPGNHEYHTSDAGGFRTFWNGTGLMGTIPRGGFAHQRGNVRAPLTLNGWTLIFLDTAGDSSGAYFVDAQSNVWTAGYIADLDGWLAAATGKAVLVFGHHMRYNPAGTGGHGNQGGVNAAWARMWNADGTAKIAAWIGGHDHYLMGTKLINQAGAVVSDETRGCRMLCSGAGAGSFDVVGTQSMVDYGSSGLYGYLKLTIPDMVGGEPQPVTAQFYTTGNNGQGADTLAKTYTLSPTGAAPPPPPPPGAPTVTTNAASSITGTGATFNATVNPNGAATTDHFEYGTTTGYGSSTANHSTGSGSADVAVSQAVTGLTAGVLYHYRSVAVNSGGTTQGGDRTFTTTGTPTGSGVFLDDDFNRVLAPGAGMGTSLNGLTYSVTPVGDWEVNGDEATAHLVSISVHEIVPLGVPQVADLEWLIQWNLGSPPSIAGQNVTGYFIFRFKDVNNLYRVRVVGNTLDAVTTAIQRVMPATGTTTPGVSTTLGAVVTSEPNGSITGGRNFQTRIRCVGGDSPRLQARTWIAANAEPAAWDVDVVDTAPLLGTGTVRSRWSIPALPTSAIGAHIDTWTATELDVTPPVPPPNQPVITGCPSSGHAAAGGVVLSWASTPAAASYESSLDGITYTADASPTTVTAVAGQTYSFRVKAVGADGQRSTPAVCTWITDTAGTSTNVDRYTPVAGDVGFRIRSRVTPANASGQGSTIVSAWSSLVGGTVATPVNTVAPAITGSPLIGQPLVLDTGTWTNTPTSYVYRWYRDGVLITGATSNTYISVVGDTGSAITGDVQGVNSAGTGTAAASSNAVIVDPTLLPPVNLVLPSIIMPGGDPNVGEALMVDDGDWDGTPPITFTYQWEKSASAAGPFTPITGATGRSYTLRQGDLGLWIDCDVTAHNPAVP